MTSPADWPPGPEVATIVTPETLLAWHRRLIAQKYDGAESGDEEIEDPEVRMAKENRSWGYRRIEGAVFNLVMSENKIA